MIVRMNEAMGEGKHLEMVVRGFKTGCSRVWWRLQDLGEMPQEQRQAVTLGYCRGSSSDSPDGGYIPVNEEDGEKTILCIALMIAQRPIEMKRKERPVYFFPYTSMSPMRTYPSVPGLVTVTRR